MTHHRNWKTIKHKPTRCPRCVFCKRILGNKDRLFLFCSDSCKFAWSKLFNKE